MESIEVLVRCSCLEEGVLVNGYVSEWNKYTQMSRRLAFSLGLERKHLQEVYAVWEDKNCLTSFMKSVVPVLIFLDERVYFCYPLIDWTESDAYWELVIGEDLLDQHSSEMRYSYSYEEPTEGPSNDGDRDRPDSLRFAYLDEVNNRVDEFLEIHCGESTSLRRVAINRVTRQLVAIYRNNSRVYRYACLPKQLEYAIGRHSENYSSLGYLMSEVRDYCPCVEIDEFPESCLVA